MPHNRHQYSDQIFCNKCGRTWDVNDPNPPKCIGEGAGREMFLKAYEALKRDNKTNQRPSNDGRDSNA